MSIAEQVARIRGEKSKIAIKLSTMGLAEQTADLETLADAIEGIPDKGAVTATVREGETYTIPKGYHNGSGTVSGINNPDLDAREFMLQTKPITPTKSQQSVTPDQGYYGLSSVTVNAIPAAFQDVSQVDATKNDVLAGKKIVKSDGTVVVGEITNRGAMEANFGYRTDGFVHEIGIPEGYHNGRGVVFAEYQGKSAIPKTYEQTICPDVGKLLDMVIVEPIPSNYKDISVVTAPQTAVLKGYQYINSEGNLVPGQIPNKGFYTGEINPLDGETSVNLETGYYASINVNLTDDLENALKEI